MSKPSSKKYRIQIYSLPDQWRKKIVNLLPFLLFIDLIIAIFSWLTVIATSHLSFYFYYDVYVVRYIPIVNILNSFYRIIPSYTYSLQLEKIFYGLLLPFFVDILFIFLFWKLKKIAWYSSLLLLFFVTFYQTNTMIYHFSTFGILNTNNLEDFIFFEIIPLLLTLYILFQIRKYCK